MYLFPTFPVVLSGDCVIAPILSYGDFCTIQTSFNPLTPELIFRHAGVDRLQARSRGAHRDLKLYSLAKFRRGLICFSGH